MLKRRSATPERRLEYQREHRELVAALKDRDSARANELCVGHLTHVRRNLLGYEMNQAQSRRSPGRRSQAPS